MESTREAPSLDAKTIPRIGHREAMVLAATEYRRAMSLFLALEPADYVLETKTLPTPGPSMKFKVRVRGLRHSGTDQITR